MASRTKVKFVSLDLLFESFALQGVSMNGNIYPSSMM